ncbi:DUF4337 family protein [Sphingomonas sp. MMS12-HWE2-04]|uniref:DUF4337 family protein n=1 Tax=Sphingomonas sp. MMS12-HWE2-04 TaxID=3234199 RepID=UPI0038503938
MIREKALNARVAITVVMLSVVAGFGGIKDSNIVQTMQQVQATQMDLWNEYQAERTKLHIAELGRDQIVALAADTARTAPVLTALDADLAHHRSEAARLATDAKAQNDRYQALDLRDSQFDVSNAAIAAAISIAGVAALAESAWLLVIAWAIGGFGLFMALCGFVGWGVHLTLLNGLLG